MTMTVALGTSTPTSMTVVATRTWGFVALETAHGYVLVVGGHAAVKEAELEAGEGAGAELFVHVGGGAELWLGEEGVLFGLALGLGIGGGDPLIAMVPR